MAVINCIQHFIKHNAVKVTPCVDKLLEIHHRGFYICQILEKKWEYKQKMTSEIYRLQES